MLVLDEATRESWRLSFPHTLLPEDNLVVVTSETEHHEKGLFAAAMKRKTEMCAGALSPAAAAVFHDTGEELPCYGMQYQVQRKSQCQSASRRQTPCGRRNRRGIMCGPGDEESKEIKPQYV